ncbi:MAG: bifunctional demethylmenaquinone methyltransferase/2-methoxy-6-polyprenyl-1,4-benzoquinol methylase UbiE [Desulfobacteraceae bacterium]|nr:bifunctional demethylmenaquinone methyltransferase/2-methoxy-6-polyprenyl-1,4-benzoquinol methylase UbiE [Desulfobacteraceae bacterium]
MKSPGNRYPSVKEIDDYDRIRIVRDIFATITGKYDFLNHFLSLRQDVFWRRFAVRQMRFFNTGRFLDVATGTSDLAIDAALRYPDIQVTGLDFVKEMLDHAVMKIAGKNLSARVNLMQGNALDLPFPDDSFDATGIAFGIRNIPDRAGALKELRRVVVPGGQVLVLELTFPQTLYFKGFYHIYLNMILPLLARVFSSNSDAYHYLGESIMNFPSVKSFAEMMKDVGLANVKVYTLTLGICHLFIGHTPKPDNPEQKRLHAKAQRREGF